MKAALVWCLRCHLLTFIHIVLTHTDVCLDAFTHRHLSLNSGLTADPECLYLFIAAMRCQERLPSPKPRQTHSPSHWGVLMKRKYHWEQAAEMSCQASQNKPLCPIRHWHQLIRCMTEAFSLPDGMRSSVCLTPGQMLERSISPTVVLMDELLVHCQWSHNCCDEAEETLKTEFDIVFK